MVMKTIQDHIAQREATATGRANSRAILLVGVLAACGSNAQTAADAPTPDSPPAPLGTQRNPAPSCLAILQAGASTGTGQYWLKAGATVFQDTCEMTIAGGGWTQLMDAFASTLESTASKHYLYMYDGRWYESPPTTLNWTWTSGQQLTGIYSYYNGATTGDVSCTGSSEVPQFGVGCSDGPGVTSKVLPIYSENPTTGMCEICDDLPDAFGVGGCTAPLVVSVFVR